MITLADIDAAIAKKQGTAKLAAPAGVSITDIDAAIARKTQSQQPVDSQDFIPQTQQIEEVKNDFVSANQNIVAPKQTEIDTGLRQQINDFILSAPGGAELAEFSSAISRGATDLADFFLNKPTNAALNLVGSDIRVPLLTDKLSQATIGNFLEDGLKKDVIRAAGEIIPSSVAGGSALRAASNAIPAAKTVTQNVIKQLGGSTAAQDLGFGAISGAGSAIGKEISGDTGELVGAILAPIGAISSISAAKKGINIVANTSVGTASKNAISDLLKKGRSGIDKIVKPVDGISEDGAGILLAEQITREGKTPEQIVKEFKRLGPDAIPADLGESFARVLRVAADRHPIISGGVRNLFNARNGKSGNRILNSLDDASGTSSLNLDDEITRLDALLKPKITELYKKASSEQRVNSKDLNFLAGGNSIKPGRVINDLLNGNGFVGKSRRNIGTALESRRLSGEKINLFSIINSTKQQMDDVISKSIRSGEKNKVRNMVKEKNLLLKEADEKFPFFKEGRDLYAGKASMQAAGDIGKDFFKLSARDISSVTQGLSESELNMFKLGAKQATLDKFKSIGINRNAMNALFGKNGDMQKLRPLFIKDGSKFDEKAFNRFNDTMKLEGNFRLTDAIVRGNSTSSRQLQEVFQESLGFREAVKDTLSLTDGLSIRGKVQKIVSGLTKDTSDKEFSDALMSAGNILMAKGMNPDKLFSILTRKNNKEIEKALRKFINRKNAKGFESSSLTESISQSNNNE